jgi:hypothetical protein
VRWQGNGRVREMDEVSFGEFAAYVHAALLYKGTSHAFVVYMVLHKHMMMSSSEPHREILLASVSVGVW